MAKFRLNRVIEIKNKFIDEKKNELELAKAELDRVESDIDAKRSEINENYESISGHSMDGNDFSVLKDYIFSLEMKKDLLIQEKEGIIERIGQLKSELVELTKEIKMFEKLKSKALNVEKKQLNRKEQKMLDEIALRIEENRI